MKRKSFTKKYLQWMLIIGLISLFVFSLNFALHFLNDYLSGFTLSFGITVILFSLIAQNSKTFMKKVEISESDERIIMIKEKQMSAGYYFHILLSVILVVVFGLFETLQIISLAIAGMILFETLFIQAMGYIYQKKF